MTSEIKEQIAHQTKTETPQQILTTLRMNENEEDPVFKAKDIYNQRQSIRHESMGNLTPTQALLKELGNNDH